MACQLRTDRISQKIVSTLQRLLGLAMSFQQFTKIGFAAQQSSTIFQRLRHCLVRFSLSSKRRSRFEKQPDPPAETLQLGRLFRSIRLWYSLVSTPKVIADLRARSSSESDAGLRSVTPDSRSYRCPHFRRFDLCFLIYFALDDLVFQDFALSGEQDLKGSMIHTSALSLNYILKLPHISSLQRSIVNLES